MSAKCPKCEAPVTDLKVDVIQASGLSGMLAVQTYVFYCSSCRTPIGVQVKPDAPSKISAMPDFAEAGKAYR